MPWLSPVVAPGTALALGVAAAAILFLAGLLTGLAWGRWLDHGDRRPLVPVDGKEAARG